MPLILNKRDIKSKERMDDARCPRQELFNTYRYFSKVNALVSGWRHIYKSSIRPNLRRQKQSSLLDIGFGGGDIPIKLARWAEQDGLTLHVTGIETDKRALEFVQTIEVPARVDFKHCSSSELLEIGACFDFVISNHLLHHLTKSEILNLLKEAESLSKKYVLFNDLKRDDLAYFFFGLATAPFFNDSFIREDGLTSIKRSFAFKELRALAPSPWKLCRLFPSHLLLSYEH